MKTITVVISDELAAALDIAARFPHRSRIIESAMWKLPEVRRAAAQLGLPIAPQRPKMGRPTEADRHH